MNDSFYYLNYSKEKIQGNDYICIYILDLEKHIVFRVFRKFTDGFEDYIVENFDIFQDITSLITFVIKRDGKVAIDIKI